MEYGIALQTAQWLVKRLRPYTLRIEIAGSLRRKKADVGDIEIACIPRIVVTGSVDLFGSPLNEEINLLTTEIYTMIKEGYLTKPQEERKTPFGPRYYKVLACPRSSLEVQVDIFCCLPPSDWGPFFTIRTGSADFSTLSSYLGGQFGWPKRVAKSGRKPALIRNHQFAGVPCLSPQRYLLASECGTMC